MSLSANLETETGKKEDGKSVRQPHVPTGVFCKKGPWTVSKGDKKSLKDNADRGCEYISFCFHLTSKKQ